MAKLLKKIFPTETHGKTVVLSPEGDSLGVEEAQLRREINALHELLDKPGITAFVVDLGGARYFSSIIIGAILTVCTKMKAQNRPTALCNASHAMLDILQIMKLDTILPYYATRAEALAAVEAGQEG
jgi:anti-anti-sigma factor